MLVKGWQNVNFVGSLEWMIQKIMTMARGTKSSSLVMEIEKNRGGDCTCRGLGSLDCCHFQRFCCGACVRKECLDDSSSSSSSGSGGVGGVGGVGGGGGEKENNGVRDVDCTGDIAYWGARAGVILSVILLGIMLGAQL